jgi:hypothetical protein
MSSADAKPREARAEASVSASESGNAAPALFDSAAAIAKQLQQHDMRRQRGQN